MSNSQINMMGNVGGGMVSQGGQSSATGASFGFSFGALQNLERRQPSQGLNAFIPENGMRRPRQAVIIPVQSMLI